jgi:hypothetical protein
VGVSEVTATAFMGDIQPAYEWIVGNLDIENGERRYWKLTADAARPAATRGEV